MTGIFLSYIIALLISIGGLFAGILYVKRMQKCKLRLGSFFLGIISAVVELVAIVLLFRVTFRTEAYYNTSFFRTLIGLLYLALMSLVRFFAVKVAFFNRDREERGFSFALGFGMMPTAVMSVYLLFMTLFLAGNSIFNGPCIIEEGFLSFADNTIVSIFRPVAGHISFSVLFLFYAVIVMAACCLIGKFAVKHYHPGIAVSWSVGLMILEGAAILPIPFMKMFSLSHWQLALIVGIIAVFSVAAVRFIPERKKLPDYIKQFE